jgi:hypothetical protein
VKEKTRNLTDWAAAALLPSSVAEEIARMEPMVFKAFRHLKAKWRRSGGHFSKAEGQRSDKHRLGDALKTMMEPRRRGRGTHKKNGEGGRLLASIEQQHPAPSAVRFMAPLAACDKRRPFIAPVATAASWCLAPPRRDFEIEKEERTLVFNTQMILKTKRQICKYFN